MGAARTGDAVSEPSLTPETGFNFRGKSPSWGMTYRNAFRIGTKRIGVNDRAGHSVFRIGTKRIVAKHTVRRIVTNVSLRNVSLPATRHFPGKILAPGPGPAGEDWEGC